jgi:hypothetical protein
VKANCCVAFAVGAFLLGTGSHTLATTTLLFSVAPSQPLPSTVRASITSMSRHVDM